MNSELQRKSDDLRAQIRAFDQVMVAWSGGVDSSLVAYIANEELGPQALAVTSGSASLKDSDLQLTQELAQKWNLHHKVILTDEITKAAYRANPVNRCFHCKTSLYTALSELGRELEIKTMLNGTNVDDLGDHRPGLVAAENFSVVSPLADNGFTKSDIRELAEELGLDNAHKPQAACLASRVPYGSHISESILAQIEAAEAVLDRHGFTQYRVRHHDEVARLELVRDEMHRALHLADKLVEDIKDCGYQYVALELAGFRSGSLNDVLIRTKEITI